MVNHAKVRRVLKAHRSEMVTVALTAIVTVTINLITAIEVGLVVAGILALRAIASGSGATQEELATYHDGPIDDTALLAEHIAIFRLDGALFFGAAHRFESISDVSDVAIVILRLKGLTLIDASGAEALAREIELLETRGITVLLKGVRAEHDKILQGAGIMAEVAAKGHLFDDLGAAITHARRHAARVGLVDDHHDA
jgi:SulP family sulfate permease